MRVIPSSDLPQYSQPTQAIKSIFKNDVTVLQFDPNITTTEMLEIIINESPIIICALGTKAAFLAEIASKALPQTKILLAQLPSNHLQKLTKMNKNIFGISLELDPMTQFLNMEAILPDVQRIGVIYSNSNSSYLKQRIQKGVSSTAGGLIAAPINHSTQFTTTLKKMTKPMDTL